MAKDADNKMGSLVIILIVAVLAFAAGYYYYEQKDNETLFSLNMGGEKITAEVDGPNN